MNAERIAYWDAKAREGYTYVSDGAVDVWRDHSADVLAGQAWQDDCDGLAETVIALCVLDGAALKDCFRLVVMASDGSGGHMVGAMRDDAKDWEVVGDTFFPGTYTAGSMQHTPKDYNCVAEAGPGRLPIWRTGVPWLAEAGV